MTDRKIIVMGAHGMLGRYVTLYLKKFYPIIEETREDFDAATATRESITAYLKSINAQPDDVIINCLGVVKPRVEQLGVLNAILVNSVFPHLLAEISASMGLKMIHPTTDYVYDGLRGGYNENDKHDSMDIYGRTKSLGEPATCTVIRTAIIGEEVNQGRSLIEWVKRNHDKEIPGYTNYHWNGMTCHQFARVCQEIIEKNLFWSGVRHLFSNNITKYELVTLINAIYSLNIVVKPKEMPVKSDHTLTSIYEPIIQIPTIGSQIADLREVEYELYGTRVAE